MTNNFLQLNTDKTEVLIIVSDGMASRVAQCIGSLSSAAQSNLRNLSVTIDQAMYLDQHIISSTCTCFFHLRNIAKCTSVVSQPELEMIIHAFISSWLDYCNSLFTCLSESPLNSLYMVQSAAARLLTRSRKCERHTVDVRGICDLILCLSQFRGNFFFKTAHFSAPPSQLQIMSVCIQYFNWLDKAV